MLDGGFHDKHYQEDGRKFVVANIEGYRFILIFSVNLILRLMCSKMTLSDAMDVERVYFVYFVIDVVPDSAFPTAALVCR